MQNSRNKNGLMNVVVILKIKIDTYYDITCQNCGFSRSTDFGKGFDMNKQRITRLAYEEGWKCKNGQTLCPECVNRKKVN